MPDPSIPQSLNRYSYVNNSPVLFLDPFGYWSCTGDGDCTVIVLNWLDYLDAAGALGQELASYFRQSDIEVSFVDGEFVMSTPSSEKIRVSNQHLESTRTAEGPLADILLFTQFGHEIEHTRQGFLDSRSAQGEYLGYKTQIELAEGWDHNHGTTTAIDMMIGNGSPRSHIMHVSFLEKWYSKGWSNLDPNSYTDMKQFEQDALSIKGHYENLPIFPLFHTPQHDGKWEYWYVGSWYLLNISSGTTYDVGQ